VCLESILNPNAIISNSNRIDTLRHYKGVEILSRMETMKGSYLWRSTIMDMNTERTRAFFNEYRFIFELECFLFAQRTVQELECCDSIRKAKAAKKMGI
jgi:hypothetical protein